MAKYRVIKPCPGFTFSVGQTVDVKTENVQKLIDGGQLIPEGAAKKRDAEAEKETATNDGSK